MGRICKFFARKKRGSEPRFSDCPMNQILFLRPSPLIRSGGTYAARREIFGGELARRKKFPHLADFAGYSAIDDRNLAGKGQSFASKREAFAYAAAALKRLLVGAGFVESEIGVFTPAE